MKSRETFLRRLFTLYIPLLLILLFILFPFYWTFITSIKPEAELYGAVTYWPKAIVWDSYKNLFTTTVNFFRCNEEQLCCCSGYNNRITYNINTGGICFFKISLRGKACDDGIIFKQQYVSDCVTFDSIVLYYEKDGTSVHTRFIDSGLYNIYNSIFRMASEWIFK